MNKFEQLLNAINNNKITIIKKLLSDKTLDPSQHDNIALFAATKKWKPKIIELLLNDERVNPASDATNDARGLIVDSASYGNINIVKLLLKDPRVDFSFSCNQAIRISMSEGYTEITKLLFNDANVKNKLIKYNIDLYNTLVKENTERKITNF